MRQKDIIAASVVLGFSFLSIMVLVTRLLWVHNRGKDKNDMETRSEYSIEPNEQKQWNMFSKDSSLLRVFVPKRSRGHWVPTLSGIIKAGDEGIYSSAFFNTLQAHAGDLTLETLYDAFASELRSRPVAERSTYPPAISKFLASSRRTISGVKRSQSVRVNTERRPELPMRPRGASVDLERVLGRSTSRRVSPVLISTFNGLPKAEESGDIGARDAWTKHVQHADYFDGRTGIAVAPADLATLSLVLGCPISVTSGMPTDEKHQGMQNINGNGAFGITIHSTWSEDGKYHISLEQHKRSISQLPARGSGYSTLFAKHLATGSLPFSQDHNTINSILISNETFEAIQSGTCLHLRKSTSQTPGSTYLSALPSSRESNFHKLTPSTTSTSTPLLLHAIAALPFSGGLPAMASTPIIDTIQFIASAGLPPARLLQRLDALVEKVHRYSPVLALFGPLYEERHAGLLFRERERLGRLATGANAEESTADKVARMGRYLTLLERLMCLVPNTRPHDVLEAAKEATKQEIERSYEDAVAAFKHPVDEQRSTPTRSSNKRHSSTSTRSRKSKHQRRNSRSTPPAIVSPPGAYPSSPPTTPPSPTSPRSSSTFPAENLGQQVEQILKISLPFSIDTIAQVARMILVAWTLSVETVAWDEGEQGLKLPDLTAMDAMGRFLLL